MEATKVKNMIDHKEEIMRRPAKSWFQSVAEKKESQGKARIRKIKAQGSTKK